jgi:hypothetical protein
MRGRTGVFEGLTLIIYDEPQSEVIILTISIQQKKKSQNIMAAFKNKGNNVPNSKKNHLTLLAILFKQYRLPPGHMSKKIAIE